jgi:hypothetical protein
VVVDCGVTGVNVPDALWDKRCGAPRVCPPVGNQTRPHPFASGFLGPDDRFLVIATWCPDGATPTPSIASLRDEVIRLLPKLPVRISPSRGVTLVNFRTLFWLDTPVERELGQSRLIGFPVTLRVHFGSARFDFGDGMSDIATAPGKRYDSAADCGRCEERFGHRYQRPARLRVSVVVTWAAQFRIGGGAWLPIPGDVTGPVATAALWVRQSGGVLVAPNQAADQRPDAPVTAHSVKAAYRRGSGTSSIPAGPAP